ncbi:MAG: hypothetical protein R2819_14455 [Allomuricauda sp.]
MNYNEIGILLGLSAVTVILLVRKKINGPYAKSIWKSALLLFSLYALILIVVEIRWYYLNEHVKSFDLDKNGFVDLYEYTEEAQKAMNKITQNTARSYAPVTVALLSSTVSFAYLLVDLVMVHLKIKNSKI